MVGWFAQSFSGPTNKVLRLRCVVVGVVTKIKFGDGIDLFPVGWKRSLYVLSHL